MANSNPNQSRSKETTNPRRGNPPPLPDKDKKPDKKIESSVMIAIISAVVTLGTAILGSPWLLTILNLTATPPSPSVAEQGISQSTLLPATPTDEGLSKATLTSGENPPASSSFTQTPEEDSSSTSPLFEITFTPAALPPMDSAPIPTPTPSLFQCIAADLWFPYPATLNPGINDGCWNLADWGFTTDQGQLLLVHNPAQDQQRGIYLPISGDVDIHFIIQMTEFRTRSNKGAFLHFGIVQNDPFSNFAGGFLSYQQPTPGASSPVRILISGNNQATQNILILEKGFQQDVLLSVQGDLMTVFVDGQPIGDPVGLTPTDRAFWIGYVLPSKGELEAVISGFTIQPR